MNFNDPFKADTSRYRDLINRDSGYVDYEDVTEDSKLDSSELLDKSTIKGLPPSIFQDVTAKAKKLEADKEKKSQMMTAFNNLFNDLNQKYGLNVKFDFDSFTSSLNFIIEPTNKRALELYISEAFSRYRVVLYSQYLQAIALLSSQILDPAYLLSESMTYADKLETLRSLYEFMQSIEEIYKEINVPDSGIKLEKIAESKQEHYSLNDPEVRKYMEQLFNKVKDKE